MGPVSGLARLVMLSAGLRCGHLGSNTLHPVLGSKLPAHEPAPIPGPGPWRKLSCWHGTPEERQTEKETKRARHTHAHMSAANKKPPSQNTTRRAGPHHLFPPAAGNGLPDRGRLCAVQYASKPKKKKDKKRDLRQAGWQNLLCNVLFHETRRPKTKKSGTGQGSQIFNDWLIAPTVRNSC